MSYSSAVQIALQTKSSAVLTYATQTLTRKATSPVACHILKKRRRGFPNDALGIMQNRRHLNSAPDTFIVAVMGQVRSRRENRRLPCRIREFHITPGLHG